MVMKYAELTALEGVREAIIAGVAEDMRMIGEMTGPNEDLVEAWNTFANAGVHGEPITDADIQIKGA